MEKVLLTKAQAKAVEIVSAYGDPAFQVGLHSKNPHNWGGDLTCSLNGMPLDTLIRALYIGYETEKTPEEKAIAWLRENACLRAGFSAHDVVMAIKHILEKGVTA